MQCSICLDDLEGGPTLACGHRFHAACLARLAGANGTTPTRRGALTACPNCRTVSRVALMPVAAFGVGDRVDALWGQKWYPGVVDAVVDGGYEILWDDGDAGEVRAAHVRAAPAPAQIARPPPVVAPPAPPPPPPRTSSPPPAPRAVVPRYAPSRPRTGATRGVPVTYRCPASCGCGLPHRRCGGCAACRRKNGDDCLAPRPPVTRPSAPLPPATRSHVASTSSAWVAACTDLLEAAKDLTGMRGLREPLTSRGFRCGTSYQTGNFAVTVPPDFPCYYDLVGKDYASIQNFITTLPQLRKYIEGALALARSGGTYRTDAEYKPRAPAPVPAPKTSRFTGVSEVRGRWRAAIGVRASTVQLGIFDDEEDAARAFDAAVVKYRGAPTVNFPGEAPLASVLAALPAAPAAPAVAPTRRSGRAPAPKVIVDPEAPVRHPVRKKARTFPRKLPYGKCIEGAQQKKNGKWSNRDMFPGREFDDLDAFRAAKKQHYGRRAAYSDQITRVGHCCK